MEFVCLFGGLGVAVDMSWTAKYFEKSAGLADEHGLVDGRCLI
jgi:hypothetical protein